MALALWGVLLGADFGEPGPPQIIALLTGLAVIPASVKRRKKAMPDPVYLHVTMGRVELFEAGCCRALFRDNQSAKNHERICPQGWNA